VSTIAVPTSPYKGLAAFEDSDLDALLFFGRDRDSQVIAANLMASRLTVLFGPTGVGKTSVLRAGVAYRLRREAAVRVLVHSSWTGDPLTGIVEAAGHRGDSLGDALAAAAGTGGELYLILDQFEEYFLYHERDRRFVEALAEVTRRPGLRVNVLIGIREDALAQLDTFKAVIPNLLSNRLRLDRLDRAAGEDAILGPVRRFNELVPTERRVKVEPELVTAVLDQVAAGRVEFGAIGRGVVSVAVDVDRIEAPYLQLVMTRLWEVETVRGSQTLHHETLNELGGAAQIVQDHLEHAMAELSPRQKDAAAAMYNFLVTPSGSKIAHGIGDLAGYAGIDEDEAVDVLRRLAAERIVRASSENGAATRYEIYHDVLADAVAAWRNRHRAGRALHDAERRRRRAFAVATAALVGLILVAAIAVFALVERSHSSAQARRAHARELAAAATSELDVNPQKSLQLAVQAAQLEPRAVEEDALRDALLANRQRAVLRASGPVRIAGFDPRGQHIVTGSTDGKVRVYRVGSTVPERVIDQGGPVTAAAYSPDGRLLTAGGDGTARLWDPKGSLSHRLTAGGPVTSASFGKRARLALTLTDNGVVRLWRVADGKLIRTIRVHGKALPEGGAIDPTGRLIVIVGQDRFARMYSIKTGLLTRLLEQEALVHCAAFSPDGSRIITCGHEGVVRVWSRVGRLVRQLRWPEAGQAINDGVFSPDGTLVAAAVRDGTARVWDVKTGERISAMFGHFNAVTKVAFNPRGDAIVTGSSDNRARTWLTTGKPVSIFTGHTGAINSVAFSPDSRSVVTAGEDGTARVWDSGTEPDLRLVAHQATISAFAVSRDGNRVLVGDKDGVARVRLVRQHRVLGTIRTTGGVTAVAFGPRGPLAAARPTLSLAVSDDGKLIVRGRTDGSVLLENTNSGVRRVLHVGDEAVTALGFSPDDELLATGGSDGAVQVWDAASGRRTRRFAGHTLGITSVAFSPDGSLLLTAGIDHEARTWDVRTGRLRHVLGLHFGPVVGASFSPDGRWIVTAGCCGASVIRVSTGERVLILRGHSQPLIGAGFAGSDGRLIVTAGKDGTIRSYYCEICGGVGDLIALANRRLRSR
jgi:WD40 repeat protein